MMIVIVVFTKKSRLYLFLPEFNFGLSVASVIEKYYQQIWKQYHAQTFYC